MVAALRRIDAAIQCWQRRREKEEAVAGWRGRTGGVGPLRQWEKEEGEGPHVSCFVGAVLSGKENGSGRGVGLDGLELGQMVWAARFVLFFSI